jgi:DNA-binding transcriptional ArsR family regulator
MADIFDVVADATRRHLLQVLLERAVGSGSGELSVGELVDRLALSQPTVSKHLRVLREVGLVTVREEGQHRYYRVDGRPLEALEEWLTPFFGAPGARPPERDGAESAVSATQEEHRLSAPLRRAAQGLQHAGEVGAPVGRAVADASHRVRTVVEGASEQVDRRVIRPLRQRLRKQAD